MYTYRTLRLAFVIAILGIAISANAQTVPDGILFQALARDPSGVPAKGRIIHIKDAILQSSATGNTVRSETFTVEASDDGVFTIIIGKGDKLAGVDRLSDIDWSAGPYFLNIKAAIEPSVPTPEWKADEQYVDMGTSQFWTVPFAFKAASVAGLELLLKAADTTAMLAPYLRKADTAYLSVRIDNALKTSDTAGMLQSYIRRSDTIFSSFLQKTDTLITNLLGDKSSFLRKTDTVFTNLLGNKLNISDTASMLSSYLKKGDTSFRNIINTMIGASDTAYLRKADTAQLFAPYLKSSDASLANKLNVTDTAAMLSAYLKRGDPLLTDALATRLSISDTAGMLSGYLKKGDTSFINLAASNKLNISDTGAMLNPYLRRGDTALTASLSGKLNISDTAAMLNTYLKKGDSALTGSLSGKLNIADTSAMLDPYLKKGDSALAGSLSGKLNISDTASMLSSFYRSATAAADLSARELLANKSASTALGVSDTLYPTQNAVKKYVDSVAASFQIADATSVQKGRVQLAGDLSGTADAPVIGDQKVTTLKIADTAVTFSKMQRVSNNILLGNASGATGAVQEITLGSGLSLTGNTLNATGSGSAQVDTFTTNLTVSAVNGLGKYAQGQVIPAKGKTAAQVLIDAITQTIAPVYTQPTVSISGTPSPGTIEIGTALNIALAATFNQNDAGAKVSESFLKNGSSIGSNTDHIAALTAAVSYSVTVSYAQGPVKNNNQGTPDPTGQIAAGSKTSGSITYTPQAKRYWGYSTSLTPTDAQILAALGGGSELSSAKAKASFDIAMSGGSNYIFFAYPASLGTLSSLTVGGFGSLPSFTLITRSVTNAQGYTQSYNIYLNPNAFSTTVTNITTN